MLGFQLLIAFRTKDQYFGLFQTDGSLVKHVRHMAVLGSGVVVKVFADTLYQKTSWDAPRLLLSEGRAMAPYLTDLAKSQIYTVGGDVAIATLGSDSIHVTKQWEMSPWENFFSWYRDKSGRLMLLGAEPDLPDDAFRYSVSEFSEALISTRRRLMSARAKWEEAWNPTPSAPQTSEDQH
jgi:hypothetical protein